MLPKAQIVKIDTEGSEIDILGRMTSFDFEVTLLRGEPPEGRGAASGFFLVGGEIRGIHRGTLKYFHHLLVKAAGLLLPRRAG